jgi:hypothetical protein
MLCFGIRNHSPILEYIRMPPKAPYPLYGAFIMGEAFRNAGDLLADTVRSRFAGEIPVNFQYVISANRALALELYFKCLIAMAEPPI